jgi:tetratricopeptide (TPR) repeat protein
MAVQKMSFKSISDLIHANAKPLLLVFSFAVAMVFLFFAYKWWVIKRERAAQYDFAFLMTEYDAMSREKDPQWAVLLEKFEKNYEKHSNSSLLPYYLGYKVQILLAQNKKEEALDTLNKMIAGIVPSSPMLAMYQMERAFVQLDSDDTQLQEVALQTLKTLANDTNNIFRDSAQYYLGRYYWSQNNIEEAREIWQQLIDEQRDEKMASSPWVDQVQAQLALTIV